MRRSLSITIVCFWLAMMALLIRRTWTAHSPPAAVHGVVGAPVAGDEWMGVYHEQQKIGYTHSALASDGTGFRFTEESLLRMTIMDVPQTVRTRMSGRLGEDFALRDVDFELTSGAGTLRVLGVVAGKELQLTLHTGKDVSKQVLPLTESLYLPSTLRASLKPSWFEAGREVEVAVFDPATLRTEPIRVTVASFSQVPGTHPEVRAWQVHEELRNVKTTAWIDTEGHVLREEGPMGLVEVRETAAQAVNEGWSTQTALDLVASAAVPVARTIDDPRHRMSLRVRLSGIAMDNVPSDGAQVRSGAVLTIRRPDVASLPTYQLPYQGQDHAADLVPTAFLQSDHPRLQVQARAIIGNERDARLVAIRLNEWVYQHLRKVPTISIPNALQVLDMGEGDCNEHSVLFAALARAAGLPARVVAGAVYLDGAFLYHAWCEVWLGRWVSIDPTFDQFPADATHIKFVVGGPDEQLAMMGIIGRLGIEVLDGTDQISKAPE